MNKKTKETELTFDQVDTECNHFDHKSAQIGISVYSIIINKWDEYQSEYLRQKPYRQTKVRDEKELQHQAQKSVTQVTPRGEERRLEEKREEEIRIKAEEKREDPPNSNSPNSPLPSISNSKISKGKTIKEDFLSSLQECRGYPFSEELDSLLFDLTIQNYPGINILEQTQIKIKWWKEHPDALKADPRCQLKAFFEEEYKFKKRAGPRKVGNIMAGIEDADHRKWLEGLLKEDKKKKEPGDQEEY